MKDSLGNPISPEQALNSLVDFDSAPALISASKQQSPATALQWARNNPNDPRAAQILQKLGVQ